MSFLSTTGNSIMCWIERRDSYGRGFYPYTDRYGHGGGGAAVINIPPGRVDKLEAVNQAIRKAIITPRFKCLIYDNQYGSEVEEAIITKDASPEYIEAVVEGFIRDALRPDTRILSIYDFQFEFREDRAYVFFRADTIFGETEIEEMI